VPPLSIKRYIFFRRFKYHTHHAFAQSDVYHRLTPPIGGYYIPLVPTTHYIILLFSRARFLHGLFAGTNDFTRGLRPVDRPAPGAHCSVSPKGHAGLRHRARRVPRNNNNAITTDDVSSRTIIFRRSRRSFCLPRFTIFYLIIVADVSDVRCVRATGAQCMLQQLAHHNRFIL